MNELGVHSKEIFVKIRVKLIDGSYSQIEESKKFSTWKIEKFIIEKSMCLNSKKNCSPKKLHDKNNKKQSISTELLEVRCSVESSLLNKFKKITSKQFDENH